jgi:hypothetical protein
VGVRLNSVDTAAAAELPCSRLPLSVIDVACLRRQPVRLLGPQGRRLRLSLLISLLAHALLLSLTLGGQEFGLPGFAFPWQDRRIEVPDLRVVLVPVPAAGGQPASTGDPLPSPPALAEQPGGAGPAVVTFRAPKPPPVRRAAARVPRSPRTAKAGPSPKAAASAARATVPRSTRTAKASPRPKTTTSAAPAKPRAAAAPSAKPFPAVIALEQSEVAELVVPAAPLEPAPALPDTPENSGGAAQTQIDQPAPERVAEDAARAESVRRESERQEAAREEAARQESARQESARQEAARQESARQEAARQEAARQDAARQEAARQEAARQEAARQEAARQEAARQETARQEAARQETTRQEAARQELARQEAARQESARQESARQESARQEAARQETARQEAARQEAARQEAARQEAARQEAARQEAARQETTRQEAARQESARQETARQEAARQGAARQETARQGAARQETARAEAARQETARAEAERQEGARQAAARQDAAQIDAARAQDARRDAVRRAMGRQLDEEAARREAAQERTRLSPSASPLRRARLFGRTDPNGELILYAEAWSRRIQLNVTIDTVREAAKRPHTPPIVTVAIRSDGSVEFVTFVRSSGVAAIDDSVRRIVHGQTPYLPFQPALARDYDVIEIRRTWHFDTAIRLY